MFQSVIFVHHTHFNFNLYNLSGKPGAIDPESKTPLISVGERQLSSTNTRYIKAALLHYVAGHGSLQREKA